MPRRDVEEARRARATTLGAFGEDPPAPAAPRPLTVTEVARRVADAVRADATLQNVLVEGEVVGPKLAPSGHFYFDLVDDVALLKGVMWSSAIRDAAALPRAGDRVVVRGSLTTYQRGSVYQLSAREIRPAGLGAAALALEALRRKLQAEGLFAEDRKRALPRHPRAVGLVTSLAGAVLHDVVDVAGRRNPAVRVLVCGARVQGATAAAEVAAAVRRLGASGQVDVVVVARGGGGADDLSAFNDEAVVRAVAQCPVPVVSAVGHETDVTLTDFAADVRAPTPSAAAELVVPDREELARRLDEAEERARAALRSVAAIARGRLDAAELRAASATRLRVERVRARFGAACAGLDAVSPLATLARGYAVVLKADVPVARAAAVAKGDAVKIRFQDGSHDAEIR